MDANLAAVIATQDAVILGRRSYTEWAQFWPSSQIQPFATFINGVTKYVATSTPLDRDCQCDGARRWAGRIRSGSQAAARRRCRRPRKYLGRAGAARRRRCRRTQARDSAEDSRPRTTTPRRLAIDSARIDPKRDLTDWLSARRLSRYSLLAAPGSGTKIPESAPARGRFFVVSVVSLWSVTSGNDRERHPSGEAAPTERCRIAPPASMPRVPYKQEVASSILAPPTPARSPARFAGAMTAAHSGSSRSYAP